MKKFAFIAAVMLLAPMAAFAQLNNVNSLLNSFRTILTGTVIPIVIALALLYFFWGLAQYILHNGEEDKREDGKRIMIWGVIALFVMTSVWGLVRYLGDALGVPNSGPNDIQLPNVRP